VAEITVRQLLQHYSLVPVPEPCGGAPRYIHIVRVNPCGYPPPPLPLVDHTDYGYLPIAVVCVCVECLPADSGQAVGCGVCDTPELWLAWRRGPVCVRVRACAGAAESLHTYIHTYIHSLRALLSASAPAMLTTAAPATSNQ